MASDAGSGQAIAKVAVVGAGTMGWQIAAMTAGSGRNVVLYDADRGAPPRAISRMRAALEPVIAAGELDWDLDAVIGHIHVGASLAEAVEHVDLVIEAVREELGVKRALFRELARLTPEAILATNSSSLPSAALVDVVSNPGRLVNLHFFDRFWQRSMVELMSCGQTTDVVMATMEEFGRSLGLMTATVRGQSKGFIINRIWRAIKRESLRVVDEGHADPEDVDRLWMTFFGTDVGPFGNMDRVGLDVIADIEDTYIAVATDPADQPSPTLHRLVNEGNLGIKTGKGFYTYPNPAYSKWQTKRLSD